MGRSESVTPAGTVRGPAPTGHPAAWDPRGTFGPAGSDAPIDRRRPGRQALWPDGETWEK